MTSAAASWSAVPAAFADGMVGEVTASVDAEFGGSIAEGEHLKLGEDGACSILLDDDGAINVDFGVAQVPETFIIDPNGVVRLRWEIGRAHV